ncbi:uncharacterized protein LOC143549303 [Bidens hawaiensis]|uniref:uncharacterized protein LOC143549303 n=1 Tax=Bidens hawaiensis TaxID=980011 RepID=UPI00404AAFB5
MATRNQSLEQRLADHDATLSKLESVTSSNLTELESVKIQLNQLNQTTIQLSQNSTKLESKMDSQFEVLMKSIQSLKESGINANRDGPSTNHNHSLEDQRLHYQGYGSFNRLSKIEFPKFNGTNVEGWLCRVEHIFSIDATPENSKVRYAIIHLEDMELLWHQGFVRSHGGFIEASIIQTSNVQDLCQEFDLALTRVTICEEYAISLFLKALKLEISNPLKLLKIPTLPEAYVLARQQEDNLKLLPVSTYKPTYKTPYKSVNSFPKPVYNPTPLSATNLPLLPTPPFKPKNYFIKTLTTKEIADKRARGECFGCNEKYSSSHKCKNKQLFSIEVWEGEDTEEYSENVSHDDLDPQISLNAIMGVTSYSTMRVTGSIGTKQLHILIDSGSTHNFLDEKIACKMNCPLKEMPSMKITVADGNVMSCTEVCENMQWMMQGATEQGLSLYSSEKFQTLLLNNGQLVQAQLFSLQLLPTYDFTHIPLVQGKSDSSQVNALLEKYLGHIITENGVSTDPSKIEAIVQWPQPTTVKQLKGFLGLAGYYRRFIKSFGGIAGPLTNLLKKDAFQWNAEVQLAFDQLKVALTTAPVLALPDFTKVFIIETDASVKGLGAVLMQDGHPLAFISKGISVKQQAMSVYDKELLAILMAVKHWHHYLIVKHFIIKTDQRSLKYLLD